MTSLQGASAKNIRYLAHSDQGGRPDGTQIMVHKGYAYIGHTFADGVSVVDVRDPLNPKPVTFLAAPQNTRCHHLQAHGDLLLVVNGANVWAMQQYAKAQDYFGHPLADSFQKREQPFAAGLRIYDISQPAAPREIAFLPVEGLGLHRIWYVGGRYAYVSAHIDGFTDHIMAVIDIADPARPALVGRWWLPGMWRAGGEEPTWKAGQRFAFHHGIVAGNLIYCAWRDGGLTVHDVSDPAAPKLIGRRNWSPPFAGGTHTPLPLPDRNLLIVADEATSTNCEKGVAYTWIVDVRDPTNPVTISTLPTPAEEDFCAKGGKFGPHNLHENRPGSFQSSTLIFATYTNAGVRAFDITDAFAPKEVARFVPPPPPQLLDTRAGSAQVIQSCDPFVDRDGVIYLTDPNAGLYILQYEGH
jgi:hypothetical protein